jgi:hypothetical protein
MGMGVNFLSNGRQLFSAVENRCHVACTLKGNAAHRQASIAGYFLADKGW